FAIDSINKQDPYTEILMDLFQFQDLQGRQTLQCSFVSKLIAIHDESRPIYDKYVRSFFGLGVPELGGISFRVAGFVANLNLLRNTYHAWEQETTFQEIINKLKSVQPIIENCSVPRLADFLVWTAGKHRLKESVGGIL
ncbi:MAG: hypothetical protein LWW75_10310, partial [Chlorobiales bacterium]|nr:hypothetical protein [Chlorobiales bacterium]